MRRFIVPTSGGHIEWKPEEWGAVVTAVTYGRSTDLNAPPPRASEATMRLPWRDLAYILASRDTR